MFKKRERPQAARVRENGDAEEIADGLALLTAPAKKKQRQITTAVSVTEAGFGSAALIGASTKRAEADLGVLREGKEADITLSGFKANDAKSSTPSNDAVRRLEVDTDATHDNRAVLERNQEIHKGLKKGSLESGVYRGLGGYKQYAERGEGAISASKFTGLLGPMRGITNVRSTLRIEYIGTTGEGGICKDYKDFGYCGFGDTCKFLHDRSDYKPSYILEKEWEDKQKAIQEKKRQRWEKKMARKKAAGEDAGDDDSDDDDESSSSEEDELPQTCPECRERWEDCKSTPVVTQCGHYFCENCALTTYARSPRCLSCDMPTHGIFNSADALEAKIKSKKAASAAKKKNRSSARGSSTYNISLEEG